MFRRKHSIIITVILLAMVFNFVFAAMPAKAQFTVTDPVTGAQTTIKNVKDFLKIIIVGGGSVALINAANFFMQKLAYDTATYLASGGKGQKPLLFTKKWGQYLEDTAKGAAGEFVGSLS